MLTILAIALVLGGLVFAALGVEDHRFHKNLAKTGAGRINVRVEVSFWESSLPGKPSLPWKSEDA